MKKVLIVVVTFSILLSSAVMADRPAMRVALSGLLGNSTTDAVKAGGDPATNRIAVPLPIVLGKFAKPMRVFPFVTVVDGDEKDRARTEAALKSELQKVAFRCNFTVVSGIKAPAGSLVFSLIIVKDNGQRMSTSYRSDSESWGGTSWKRGTSNHSSSSSSCCEGGESTFVGSSASGGLDLVGADGSTEGIAFVDNIFSANEDKTASSHRSSSSRSYYSSSKKWGSSGSSYSSSSGSEYRDDPDYSRSMSSRVTIAEAVEKAVFCVLARGIDYYNITHASTTAPAAQTTTTPATPVEDATTVHAVAVKE